jgi:hypothetical protein
VGDCKTLAISKLNSTLTVLILWIFPHTYWVFSSVFDVEHFFLAYIRTGSITSPQSTVMAKASTAKSTRISEAKLALTTSGKGVKENLVGKPSIRS